MRNKLDMISHRFHQNIMTIVSRILIIALPMVGIFTGLTTDEDVATMLHKAEAKQIGGLNLEGLLDEAQLIILGRVLDEKRASVAQPGTVGPLEIVNHTVFVEKVISGTYAGDTLGVVDGLHKNERVFLFLYPIFSDMDFGSNVYAIANLSQGKFEVDDNLLVHGASINAEGMTIGDFEKKITDSVAEHLLNDTQSDIEADLYRNDTDLTMPDDRDLTTEEAKVQERNTTGDFIVK